MKKITLLATAIAIVFVTSNVLAQSFEEGTKVGQVGYGFPNMGKVLFKAIGDGSATDYKAKGIGPIHGRFEYGLTDKFGLGLSINFNTYGAEWSNVNGIYNSTTGLYTTATYDVKVTSFNILVRGSRHWDVNDKVDIYSGFGLGYNSRKATIKTNEQIDK